MVGAYADYNAGVEPAARLAGLQFDVEPYLLPEYGTGKVDWGARHRKQVRIALEAGEIAPETQRRYVRADAGEAVHLLRLKLEGQQVLALLKEPLVAGKDLDDAKADAFRLQSTREIDGSATTFHKDKPALLRLLSGLENDFSAWGQAFGGIALHELR